MKYRRILRIFLILSILGWSISCSVSPQDEVQTVIVIETNFIFLTNTVNETNLVTNTLVTTNMFVYTNTLEWTNVYTNYLSTTNNFVQTNFMWSTNHYTNLVIHTNAVTNLILLTNTYTNLYIDTNHVTNHIYSTNYYSNSIYITNHFTNTVINTNYLTNYTDLTNFVIATNTISLTNLTELTNVSYMTNYITNLTQTTNILYETNLVIVTNYYTMTNQDPIDLSDPAQIQLFGASSTNGISSNALHFDGSSYAVMSNQDSVNFTGDRLTLSLWVYWSTDPFNWAKNQYNYASIISKNGSTQWELAHANNNRKFQFNIETTAGTFSLTSSTQPQADTWYHVAAVYDGSALTIYVDGEQENSIPANGFIIPSDTDVNLGRRSVLEDRYFHGMLDRIGIYSQAWSASSVQFEYLNGL